MPLSRFLTRLILCLGLAMSFAPLPASALDGPILTVEGLIEGGPLKFTRAELEALGTEKMTTSTPWDNGAVTFEGVSLKRLLEAVKSSGTTAEVTALNAYYIDIPTDDMIRNNALLALKKDGEYMSVADKGPLFIIYPFDADPSLRTEVHYSRSVWQVRSIALH